MAKYRLGTTMTAELYNDVGGQVRDFLLSQLEATLAAEGDGYRPVGEPVIDCHQITETEAAMHLSMARENGYTADHLPPGYQAGDWRLWVTTETEPLASGRR